MNTKEEGNVDEIGIDKLTAGIVIIAPEVLAADQKVTINDVEFTKEELFELAKAKAEGRLIEIKDFTFFERHPIGQKVYFVEGRIAEKRNKRGRFIGFHYPLTVWPYQVTEHFTENGVDYCGVRDINAQFSDFKEEQEGKKVFLTSEAAWTALEAQP